jgi:cytochrome c-type biogenesis protein
MVAEPNTVMATTLVNTVSAGSLLLAVPVVAIAGLISFLSPCVLPLAPGYLSYVTGLAGADLEHPRRGRLLLGTSLFIAGFTAVFVSFGALLGGVGTLLLEHQRLITRIMGAFVIVFGLAFMGLVPSLQRERRLHRRPPPGLLGAPLLGVTFGIGWTPCIGPTLAAVQVLAFSEASAARGALLTVAYCLGLGLPFIALGMAFRRAAGALGWIRSHRGAVTITGGLFLVATGILLVTGVWDSLTISMRVWTAGFQTLL